MGSTAKPTDMKHLIILLLAIGFIWHVDLPAQQYANQYSSGYEHEPYQPARIYPLEQYHPAAEAPACLTCNDCQVVNQPVFLPVASLLWLQGKRLSGQEVALQWEIFSNVSLSEITLLWSAGGAFEALWQGDEWSDEAFLHQLAPASPLMYQLVATDQDGQTHYSNIVEIAALSGNNDLLMYPNPGSGRIWLKVKDLDGQVEVVMRDLQGREVVRGAKEASGDQVEVNIPASLSKGIYTVELRTPTNRWQGQWIHQ